MIILNNAVFFLSQSFRILGSVTQASMSNSSNLRKVFDVQ